MKKLITLIFGTILFVSCNKDQNLTKETSKNPLFVKVEAVHLDGQIITSNIILVR
jgi:hypothetical protein